MGNAGVARDYYGILGVGRDAGPDEIKRAYRRLAREQGDLFGIFTHSHEIVAEVGFVALLHEVEANQRAANPLRDHGAEN